MFVGLPGSAIALRLRLKPEVFASVPPGLAIVAMLGIYVIWISDIISFLTGKLSDLYNSLVSIVDYLNPMSNSFILKIAFIPEQGYFQGKFKGVRRLWSIYVRWFTRKR